MNFHYVDKPHVNRRTFVGPSDACIIIEATTRRLSSAFGAKRGETGLEDLSGNLIVQLGTVTPLIRHAREALARLG